MKRNVTMIDDLPELEDEKDTMMPVIRGIRPTVSAQQMQQPQMQPQPVMIHSQVERRMPMYEEETLPSFDRQPVGFIHDVHNKSRIYCIDVAEHINSCPICSKFYNVDKTPYILAIIILSIVCIILLKRVLSI